MPFFICQSPGWSTIYRCVVCVHAPIIEDHLIDSPRIESFWWDGHVSRMTWLEQWPSQACKHGELYRCSVDWKVREAWLDRARKKGFTHYVGFLTQFAKYDCATVRQNNARIVLATGIFWPYPNICLIIESRLKGLSRSLVKYQRG